MTRFWFWFAAIAVGATSCDSRPPPPDRDAPPERPPAVAASGTTQSSAPAQSAIAAPAGSAIASSAAGAWEGTFAAAKGAVHMPESVKDAPREKDDGKQGVGPGKVSISVGPDGEVTGSWTGALGKNTLRGRVEIEGGQTMLRASAMPEDPTARDAMSGILVGELKGDVFHAEIHVSAGDAVTVREATFDLRRK
jgi:hypothetical protein